MALPDFRPSSASEPAYRSRGLGHLGAMALQYPAAEQDLKPKAA
jgi:hypothetical protein